MIYRNTILYILLFIKICVIYSQNVNITAIVHSFYDNEYIYYRVLTDGFNEYSRENGLGINIQLIVLTPENSTSDFENYGTMIDSLLKRKSTKYDIIYYYSAYTKKYGNHFLNIRDYISEDYIKIFDERLLEETCSSYDKTLVSLPVFIDISTLLSNQVLLQKYNKDIPKTWDELLSTSKYIYDEEKKLNNTIIRYYSTMNENSGSVSVYEFINSFRKSNDSPHPEITSKTTVEALKKIKEMKDELGEDILSLPEDQLISIILNGGNALFIRYFYIMHDPMFKATALPGRKEGVSGTVVISTNIAVNKYINEDKKKAAAEFLKFLASKESQKKYIINNNLYSGVMDLYDDEEVCSIRECDVVKDAYPFSFMNNDIKLFGDDNYHINYRENMFDYIYRDKPVSVVLKKIEDITKIYKLSLKTKDSSSGLIIFIIYLSFVLWMISSLIFIFIKKFESRFMFLSNKLWIITTLGSLTLISSLLTLYGDVTNASCHLKITLINVGFVLSIYPSLNTLIINFPENNKISFWFKKCKYISLLITMIFTATLNGIFAMVSYDSREITMSDKRLYKKCIMNNKFGNAFYYVIQFYNILVIVISLILIFMEWNIKETSLDVKYLATAMFMDILSLIIFNIIDKITFKNYVIYNVLLAVTILIFAVLNHLFIYFIRILPIFEYNSKFEDSRKILGKISKNDSKKESSLSNSTNDGSAKMSATSSNDTQLNKITKKIISYHNKTSSNSSLN